MSEDSETSLSSSIGCELNPLKWILKHVLVMGEVGDAPLFVWGDIPACISLFVQNVTSMVMIATFCKDEHICDIPSEIVNGKIIPGTALAIAIGNICFWYQGRRVVRNEKRQDVCAQPLGINTPDVFSFIFNIMAVIHAKNNDGTKAWQAGLLANFASAVVTLLTIPFGRRMLAYIPRPALFSALAGIAGTFLALGPLLRMYQSAMIGVAPALMLVLLLLAKVKPPFGIPLVIVQWIASVGLAWCIRAINEAGDEWESDFARGEFVPTEFDVWRNEDFGFYTPSLCWSDWLEGFKIGLDYVGIWLPLAIVSVAEVLINLSIASKLGKDSFDISSSLLINALSCMCGSLLGSPFPSVTFIGHPTFKALGGRTGYPLLQALLILAMSFWGGFTFLLTFMPVQAFYPMVVLIGIDILSETFGSVSSKHLAAVSVGLLPAFANFLWSIVENAIKTSLPLNATLLTVSQALDSSIQLSGIISLAQGFVLTGMLLSTCTYFLIERYYGRACMSMAILACLTASGLVHSFSIDSSTGVVSSVFFWQCWCVHAKEETLSYLFLCLIFFVMHACANSRVANRSVHSVHQRQPSIHASTSHAPVESAKYEVASNILNPWKKTSQGDSVPKDLRNSLTSPLRGSLLAASKESTLSDQYHALDGSEDKSTEIRPTWPT